jgi:hypothetical protein
MVLTDDGGRSTEEEELRMLHPIYTEAINIICHDILIPPSLKISESSSNGSYRNTDKV